MSGGAGDGVKPESGGAGDGVKPESGEVSGGIATVLRQLAKFLRLEVMCLPNRETNYELCHQLTGLDHLDHLGGFSPSADNQCEKTGKEVKDNLGVFRQCVS